MPEVKVLGHINLDEVKTKHKIKVPRTQYCAVCGMEEVSQYGDECKPCADRLDYNDDIEAKRREREAELDKEIDDMFYGLQSSEGRDELHFDVFDEV